MMFSLIEEERGNWPVPAMCKQLGVSVSGFYRWRSRRGCPDRRRRSNEAELKAAVKRLHRKDKHLGRPRLVELLRQAGYQVGSKRVRRIMQELGIQGLGGRKRKRGVNVPQTHTPAAPNLLERNFSIDEPNRVWTGDITELCVRQAKLRMAIVIDLHSRMLVGSNIDPRMTTELVTGALKCAVRARKPAKGLIFHSDQGVQYKSRRYRNMLRVLGFRQSMSRRGNCWDNAPTESFFATLKKELVYARSWTSRSELERAIKRYIKYYNQHRIHTALGLRSPRAYEQDHAP